jgi:hypothetical protein
MGDIQTHAVQQTQGRPRSLGTTIAIGSGDQREDVLGHHGQADGTKGLNRPGFAGGSNS